MYIQHGGWQDWGNGEPGKLGGATEPGKRCTSRLRSQPRAVTWESGACSLAQKPLLESCLADRRAQVERKFFRKLKCN